MDDVVAPLPGGSAVEPPPVTDSDAEAPAEPGPGAEEPPVGNVDGPEQTPTLPVPAEPEHPVLPETSAPDGVTPDGVPPDELPTEPDEPVVTPLPDDADPDEEPEVEPPPVDEPETPPDDPPSEDPPDDDPPGEDPPDDDPPGGVEPPPLGNGSVGPGSPQIPNGLPEFHISVIGSSTANGIGASVGDFAWVTLLDEALSRRVATRYSTSNLAVGGYKAADLLPGSGERGSIDEAIAEKPDLIVVALAGSNDIEPGFTTELFMSQMSALRDAAKAAGIPAFFMSPLPKSLSVGEREILGEWSGLMKSEFSQCWIPGTSEAYAPCYIDVFDALAAPDLGLATQYDSGDGQHPNDLGHSLLFDAVDAIVQPYVCTKTECR